MDLTPTEREALRDAIRCVNRNDRRRIEGPTLALLDDLFDRLEVAPELEDQPMMRPAERTARSLACNYPDDVVRALEGEWGTLGAVLKIVGPLTPVEAYGVLDAAKDNIVRTLHAAVDADMEPDPDDLDHWPGDGPDAWRNVDPVPVRPEFAPVTVQPGDTLRVVVDYEMGTVRVLPAPPPRERRRLRDVWKAWKL